MDVVHVQNLAPDLLTKGVQGREVLCRLAYPLVHSLILYERGIIVLLLVM